MFILNTSELTSRQLSRSEQIRMRPTFKRGERQLKILKLERSSGTFNTVPRELGRRNRSSHFDLQPFKT